MAAIPSRRRDDWVVFHCPNCFDDRVGVVMPTCEVRCLACNDEVRSCAVARGPVGTDFLTRITAASRSLLAAIVATSTEPDVLIDLAVDLAGRFAVSEWAAADLSDRVNEHASLRARRLTGDLLVACEDLRRPGRRALLDAAHHLASASGTPTRPQHDLLVTAGELLSPV